MAGVSVWCRVGVVPLRGPHEFRTGCDGLAAVGVGAVGGVELFGPVGHRGELFSGAVEFFDVLVEVRQVPFEEIGDVVAGAGAVLSHVEDGGDFGEGESGGLGVADEPEPIDGFVSVFPVAVWGAFGLGKDSDVLVVANGFGRDADSVGEFSDLHDSIVPP